VGRVNQLPRKERKAFLTTRTRTYLDAREIEASVAT